MAIKIKPNHEIKSFSSLNMVNPVNVVNSIYQNVV